MLARGEPSLRGRGEIDHLSMRRPRRMGPVHVHVNYVQLSHQCQPSREKWGRGKASRPNLQNACAPGEPDKGESAPQPSLSRPLSELASRGSGLTAFCPSRFARLFFSSAQSLLISTAVGGAEHDSRKRQTGHVQRWHGVCNYAGGFLCFCGRTDLMVLLRLRLRHLIAAAGSQPDGVTVGPQTGVTFLVISFTLFVMGILSFVRLHPGIRILGDRDAERGVPPRWQLWR